GGRMAIRSKFILALLINIAIAVGIVGVVAHELLMQRFDAIALARSARNFRGDIAAYWLTYGSWEDGQKVESLHHFIQRRDASLIRRWTGTDPNGSAIQGTAFDKGDAVDALAITPWSGPRDAGTGPAGQHDLPPGQFGSDLPSDVPPPAVRSPDGPRGTPPFIFILFDHDGHVLNPPNQSGRIVPHEERVHAIPIDIHGKIVAYALPQGRINLSGADRSYIEAMWQSLAIGVAAASAIGIALGLFFGNRMSRALRQLTAAVQNIRDGRLVQTVSINSNDEVGVLARAFNEMSEELALSHAKLKEQNRTIGEQAERLRDLATRDGLTQLNNRRYFDEAAERMFALARRHGRPLAIAVGDLDHFKNINDSFSHTIGDAVLRQIAELMQRELRANDLVARYGGEEFIFAFAETDLAAAVDCCERLRRAIEGFDWTTIQPGLAVTISIGTSDDVRAGSLDRMVSAADRQLYRAKAEGRNRVCSALVPGKSAKSEAAQ
ncbi:MAG: diguanylate cyclase, partial [Ancalomicrobiaceae bacterium]|nr:diguanylate cyclase [Ancalomicrobiaceae bacterium]